MTLKNGSMTPLFWVMTNHFYGSEGDSREMVGISRGLKTRLFEGPKSIDLEPLGSGWINGSRVINHHSDQRGVGPAAAQRHPDVLPSRRKQLA